MYTLCFAIKINLRENIMPHNTHTKKPNNIQTEICKRYEVLPLAPEEKVAVALNSLNDNPIYGTRIELPEAGTISWFFLLW